MSPRHSSKQYTVSKYLLKEGGFGSLIRFKILFANFYVDVLHLDLFHLSPFQLFSCPNTTPQIHCFFFNYYFYIYVYTYVYTHMQRIYCTAPRSSAHTYIASWIYVVLPIYTSVYDQSLGVIQPIRGLFLEKTESLFLNSHWRRSSIWGWGIVKFPLSTFAGQLVVIVQVMFRQPLSFIGTSFPVISRWHYLATGILLFLVLFLFILKGWGEEKPFPLLMSSCLYLMRCGKHLETVVLELGFLMSEASGNVICKFNDQTWTPMRVLFILSQYEPIFPGLSFLFEAGAVTHQQLHYHSFMFIVPSWQLTTILLGKTSTDLYGFSFTVPASLRTKVLWVTSGVIPGMAPLHSREGENHQDNKETTIARSHELVSIYSVSFM